MKRFLLLIVQKGIRDKPLTNVPRSLHRWSRHSETTWRPLQVAAPTRDEGPSRLPALCARV